ncbi:hypothetical protein ACLI1A_08050 [Flavobacterium sp. RHBU_3]|uniref:hypothetical protein n=1 Tax=Flavobacterium sp. RHBU_3 TaxID=3391184 RepID=UPI003984AD91
MKEKGKHIAGGTHKTPLTEGGKAVPKAKYDDGKNEEETDKYLALEQEGVTYTKEQDTEKVLTT